jgi:hypothetical protein
MQMFDTYFECRSRVTGYLEQNIKVLWDVSELPHKHLFKAFDLVRIADEIHCSPHARVKE